MKAKVYVTLKSGVLDPQGQAVGRTLGKLGYEGVKGVRIGKFVEIELEVDDPKLAEEQVTKMCDELIANTVMENYRVEID
ncbi:MAG: phosphoribosylformylglycinamidine synthase subunit PurS [Myxococcales bacterium]|nr:phosphoribosylformylglycinamidine synthase subunit PurS [Myxococcales bacterium]